MTELTERFLMFYDYLIQSGQVKKQDEFQKKTKINKNIIGQLRSGATKNPSGKTIEFLLKNYNELDANWLMIGQGPMLKTVNPEVPGVITVDSDNKENVVFIDIKAAAGYPEGYNNTDFINQLPVYNLPGLSNNVTYRMFEVKGSSMYPALKNKDIIVCEFASRSSIKDNKIYVINLKDGVLVKLVINNIKKDNTLRLVSINSDDTNDEYKDKVVHADEVLEMWRVIKVITEPFKPY
jgi:phage repressor protein C with HTH and peptisase S24 domain